MKNNIKKGFILGMISIFLLTACSKDGGGDTPNPDKEKSSKQEITNFSKEFNTKLKKRLTVPEGLKKNSDREARNISREIEANSRVAILITEAMSQVMEKGKEVNSQTARGMRASWSDSYEFINTLFESLSEVGEYTWEAGGEKYHCKIYESGDKLGFVTTVDGVVGGVGLMEKDFSYLEITSLIPEKTTCKIWLTEQYYKLEGISRSKLIIKVNADGSGYYEEYSKVNDALWERWSEWGVDGHGVLKRRHPDGTVDVRSAHYY